MASIIKSFTALLRLRACLARSAGAAPGIASSDATHLRFGAVEVDFDAYSLVNDGRRHGLSRRELELLRYFLHHDGETLDRLRILSDVWGPEDDPTTRTVDQHVLKLRKKIEDVPSSPRHILTVHGTGYRFEA